MRFLLVMTWILACVLPGCGGQGGGSGHPPEAVVVFAAASTKEAIEQVTRDFQAQHGSPVEVSLGPSSGLAKQIERERLLTSFFLPTRLGPITLRRNSWSASAAIF